MKLEVDKNEILCLGQILRVLNNCRWYDDSGQAVVGHEAIRINGEILKAINLFNRFMKAEEGGLKTAEIVKEEKIEAKKEKIQNKKKKEKK